jgi:O-antigen/teichoic acid export membrane protein
MKNNIKKNISGGTILVISLMVVNLINFVFNAFLGRVLSFDDFGLITLINTFLYIAMIAFNALSTTVNHKIAYLSGENNLQKEQFFFKKTLKKTVFISILISLLWIIAIPFIDNFFKIGTYLVPLLFTPIITLGVITSIDKGFLQGTFRFQAVAIIITLEAFSKLVFAYLFVRINLNYWTYVAIPLSIIFAFLLATSFTVEKNSEIQIHEKYVFPKKFFFAALLTGIASIAFLTIDVLLVKHFLSPTKAGQYALLSLIGKMVFFFGSLPTALIVTFTTSDEGNKRDSKKSFYTLLSATILFSVGAFIFLGLFGSTFVPILFGQKSQVILPYLTTYSAAIMFYTIASSLVIYHLAKRQYIFPKISAAMAVFMSFGIIMFHHDIGQITSVVFFVSVVSLLVLSILHIIESHTKISQLERFFTINYE